MADGFSVNSLASALARETGEVWLSLVTFKAASGGGVLTAADGTEMRFVNNNESVTSNGNLFLPMMMDVQRMSQREGELGKASILVSAVDRTAVSALDSEQTPPLVDIQYIIASEPNNIIADNLNMKITSFSLDGLSIRLTVEPPQFFREQVPSVTFNPTTAPAIFGLLPD